MSKNTDKYNGFKVPSKFDRTARWCLHIYTLIKEARQELLQRDDVRIAYNNLVDCLNKYKGSYVSVKVRPYMKYSSYIKIKPSDPLVITHILYDDDAGWDGEPGRWTIQEDFNTDEGLIKIQACRVDIMNTYSLLYELIKRDVIPYMEMKTHERIKNLKSKYYCSRMKRLESIIKTAEDKIEKTLQKMVEYSKQYDELQKLPKFTTFD
jgi:hypothetical protein